MGAENKALDTLSRYTSIWFMVGIKIPSKAEKYFERREMLRDKAKEEDFGMTLLSSTTNQRQGFGEEG